MAIPEHLPLRVYLDGVLATSNRLVADLCEPVDRLGLSREEHLVLLLLWGTDGMPEPLLVERLHVPSVLVEQALRSLEEKTLIEREERGADVWLTQEGRQAREYAGRGEMRSRLRLLEQDIAELRDMLHCALDLVGEEMAGFGAEAGRA